MKQAIFLLLSLVLVSLKGFGQENYPGAGDERLVPLRVNAQISKRHFLTSTTVFKSPGPQFYFLLDTLSLPFIDDFSGYKLKSYD